MRIRIGTPAAPEDDALPLLPSGPDGVRRASPRRTHPDTQADYTMQGRAFPSPRLRHPSPTAWPQIATGQAGAAGEGPGVRAAIGKRTAST